MYSILLNYDGTQSKPTLSCKNSISTYNMSDLYRNTFFFIIFNQQCAVC